MKTLEMMNLMTKDTEIFRELEEMAMNEQEIREALIEWCYR
jgi:hypothetical protein